MKNKKIIYTFLILTIISFIVGFSYAYYTTQIIGNDTANTKSTTLGTLQLTYNGTNTIGFSNAFPGDTTSKTFTVKNTGTATVDSYDIYLSNLTNEFVNHELVYSITCSSSDANPCTSKAETIVPKYAGLSFVQGNIAANTTHTYTITLKFLNKSYEQNYNAYKNVSFKVTINTDEDFNMLTSVHTVFNLADGGYWYDEDIGKYFWDYRQDITSITFEDEINIPNDVEEVWDISEQQNGKIMSYMIDDGSGDGTYSVFIQSDEEIYANYDCSKFFWILEN